MVHVRKGFVGTVHVATCVGSSASGDVYANTDGQAETSMCPARGEDVAVSLKRGVELRTMAPEEVVMPRTGDGIVTSIQVNVRP